MVASKPPGSCRVCGGAGSTMVASLPDPSGTVAGAWDFVRCRACGLVWLHPRPGTDVLAAAYSDYYTHAEAAAPRRPSRLGGHILRRHFDYDVRVQDDGLAALLSRAGPVRDSAGAEVMYLHRKPGGRLLDVGCGSGAFLSMMRDLGWDVRGVEPDEAAVRRASFDLRPRLHAGSLESAAFDEAGFDAITMHHVIEHVPDPVATLSACARLLAPGGRLVIMTPNADALGRRIFGRRWLHWDPPRHLHLFNRRSLEEAAMRAGLDRPAVRTTARGARWTWRASRSGAQGVEAGRARGVDAVAFQLVEHALLWLGLGEELVLVAEAVGSAS